MSTTDTFGTFIEVRRKELGLTMRKFAEMIEVTAPYLSDIEKGRRAAPDSKLEQIASSLQLNREDREKMYDLAALTRDNQVSTDLSGYIMENDQARVALRRAKERNLDDDQWARIISIIENGDRNG